MKFTQLSVIPGHKSDPPMLACLGEDGNVYIYRPEVAINHGHSKVVLSESQWSRLRLPENFREDS